jgi:hypothetical protein
MFDSLVAVVLRSDLGNIVIDEGIESDPPNRRVEVIEPLILWTKKKAPFISETSSHPRVNADTIRHGIELRTLWS